MKFELKTAAFLFVVLCYIQTTTCVPIAQKNSNQTEIDKSTELADPCEELEALPKCNDNDEECAEKDRKKRQTLCEKNPSCCGKLISGELDDNEEPLEVDPEVVAPITVERNDKLEAPAKKLIERNIIIENDNETQYYRGYVESGANVTTIIRLTNVIKNENIINMPTTLNNTNINNVHVYQNRTSEEGGKFGLGYTEKGSCCLAVEPKRCKQSTAGTKCHHKKQKVCGRQCTSKVIHPKKNDCSYTPQWPYVICPNNQHQQPGFYPPNNPGYYPPSNPGFYPGNQGFYPGYYPQNPPAIDEFDDDDDLPMFPDDDLLENPESGWVVGPEKCKIVSEDGLQIFNCTNKGVEFEHPFARNTASEPIKREARHANYHSGFPSPNQMMQQPMMYPVMYQPIMMQPMPVFYPPYYGQPQQMNYYQAQQIPQPPVDDFSENDETNEIPSFEKPRKHSRKHHPIVMEIDEEL